MLSVVSEAIKKQTNQLARIVEMNFECTVTPTQIFLGYFTVGALLLVILPANVLSSIEGNNKVKLEIILYIAYTPVTL